MFLVVDANIMFSFFNKNSARRKVVERLRPKLELIAPDFAFEELIKDKGRVQKYARISSNDFLILFSLLENVIKSVPKSEYDGFFNDAEKLAPHSKDIPYFALALSLNCAIWSDENSFKKQPKVKVFSTSDLVKELKL